jgi:hypothetical protein
VNTNPTWEFNNIEATAYSNETHDRQFSSFRGNEDSSVAFEDHGMAIFPNGRVLAECTCGRCQIHRSQLTVVYSNC